MHTSLTPDSVSRRTRRFSSDVLLNAIFSEIIAAKIPLSFHTHTIFAKKYKLQT